MATTQNKIALINTRALEEQRALIDKTALRTLSVANQAGMKALLVHAISKDAHKFYIRCVLSNHPWIQWY